MIVPQDIKPKQTVRQDDPNSLYCRRGLGTAINALLLTEQPWKSHMTAVIGRRELLAGLSGAVVLPLAARAQRPMSLHIGIVTIQPRTTPVYAAFDQRLRELGHIEGLSRII
jgi:hypothetical protein